MQTNLVVTGNKQAMVKRLMESTRRAFVATMVIPLCQSTRRALNPQELHASPITTVATRLPVHLEKSIQRMILILLSPHSRTRYRAMTKTCKWRDSSLVTAVDGRRSPPQRLLSLTQKAQEPLPFVISTAVPRLAPPSKSQRTRPPG